MDQQLKHLSCSVARITLLEIYLSIFIQNKNKIKTNWEMKWEVSNSYLYILK